MIAMKYLKHVCLSAFVISLGFLLINLIPKIYTYAQELLSGDIKLEAALYDNSQYSLGGEGIKLTSNGATVTGWQYDTSRYLQIHPTIPEDNNVYVVGVSVPKELYFVTNDFVTPAGYSKVEFTKNPDFAVNGGTNTFPVNNHSGTAYYTIAPGVLTSTIQLEITYDKLMWNFLGNSPLTESSVPPVEVKLYRKNGETLEELKSLSVKEAYSNSRYSVTSYDHFTVNGVSDSNNIKVFLDDSMPTLVHYLETWPSSQAREKFYYDDFNLVINLPKCTDASGVVRYVDVDLNSLGFYNFYGTADYTVDSSQIANGVITINFKKAYFYSTSFVSFKYTFPSTFNKGSLKTFTFSGGTMKQMVKDKNGTYQQLTSGGLNTTTFLAEKTENITMSAASRSVTNIGRAHQNVNLLGGIQLINNGMGDSEPKTITYSFDTTNTGNIKVTTINLPVPAKTKQPVITVNYQLVDDDGNLVYWDASGNVVSSDTPDSSPNLSYQLKNGNEKPINNMYVTLKRNMLPEKQRAYYFKEIQYTVNTFEGNLIFYSTGGSAGTYSAGNFFGYIKQGATTSATTQIVIRSQNNTKYSDIKRTSTTSFASSSTPSYGIEGVQVNNTSNKIVSIAAGNSINLSGRISVSNYPYGNTLWMSNIVIGLILPQGISINEESIVLTTNAGKTVTGQTVTSTALDDGKFLWKIVVPSDLVIGYANEDLGAIANGSALKFNFKLDTSYYMSQQTILLNNSIFAASQKTATSVAQTNAASGAWGWSKKTDVYDINGNGATNDSIGGMTVTDSTSFEITPQSATFEIDDRVSGLSGEDSKEMSILTKDDLINYKLSLNCVSGGQAKDFLYYIPIPKNSSIKDNYLITNKDHSFDMNLQSSVGVTGNDVYNILYSFDSGLNYNNANQDTVKWYTKEEIDASSTLDYKAVTMIKLTSKNSTITNGSSTTINVKLKYAGSNYDIEVGNYYQWQSAGSYHYTINGRVIEGNFSTNGVKVSLKYYKELPIITLTAAPNRTPLIDGNVIEYTMPDNALPLFINPQNYKISKVETYNTTLQTKNYINSNLEMDGVYANETFALTTTLNGGSEVDILSNANTTPINVGTSVTNKASIFKYQIYNANNISDSNQNRYIILTYTSDNGVTLKQRININRELAVASDPNSAIVAGSRYQTFDDKTESVTISSDSSVTSQFVVTYIPNIYESKKMVFSNNLPVGTTITLLDRRTGENPTYWYYRVEDPKKEIMLREFSQMGTNQKNYTNLTGDTEVEEIFLVIINFSQCTTITSNQDFSVHLELVSSTINNFISKELSFALKTKRTSSFTVDKQTLNFGDPITFNYKTVASTGIDTTNLGKKYALVLQAPSTIPVDTYALVDQAKYQLGSDNKIIIPLTDVALGDGQLKLQLQSNINSTTITTYTWSASLYITSTSNASQPMFGTKIASVSLNIKNNRLLNPAFQVLDTNNKIITVKSLANNQTISVKYKADTGVKISVELQQKVGSGYQKVTDKLNQVNGVTEHTLGQYQISLVNGENTIRYKLASSTAIGTYRLLFIIKDSANNTLSEVPYAFVIAGEI